MNTWLKIALYAFIGVLAGTFLIGIMTPGSTMVNGMGSNQIYSNGYPMMNAGSGPVYNMPMHRGMGMRHGMGMMSR